MNTKRLTCLVLVVSVLISACIPASNPQSASSAQPSPTPYQVTVEPTTNVTLLIPKSTSSEHGWSSYCIDQWEGSPGPDPTYQTCALSAEIPATLAILLNGYEDLRNLTPEALRELNKLLEEAYRLRIQPYGPTVYLPPSTAFEDLWAVSGQAQEISYRRPQESGYKDLVKVSLTGMVPSLDDGTGRRGLMALTVAFHDPNLAAYMDTHIVLRFEDMPRELYVAILAGYAAAQKSQQSNQLKSQMETVEGVLLVGGAVLYVVLTPIPDPGDVGALTILGNGLRLAFKATVP